MDIIRFVVDSFFLGVGLAMDAFSVSLANGLKEPQMKGAKRIRIAGVFAGFQYLMPMIGWLCVHTIVEMFSSVQTYIPWIALALLLFIGGKMLIEGIRTWSDTEIPDEELGHGMLIIQGIATSIDALSVGFTIASYSLLSALICGLIIAVVTFLICMVGLYLGKKLGMKLAGKASVLGGVILIAIGIRIVLG